MNYFTLKFQVKDFGTFKNVFDANERERKSHGISTVKAVKSIENPDTILVMLEAPSVNIIKERINDPGLHKKWEEAGMIGKPEVNIYED